MLEIIKEGIKLNQSLALLPLKAARKLVGGKNQGAKQVVDVAEDMVSMPFVAATKIIDNSIPDCKDRKCQTGDGQKPAADCQGGPSIRNIWVDPEIAVFSDVDIESGQKRAILTVTGLLCGG